jgi:hypothetical protein
MRPNLLAALFVSGSLTAACTGSGQVNYSGSAEYSTPELVEVEPGVQVVADYDEPVFYSDNYYWRYNAGIWYRSNDYRHRDWVRVEAPAPRVARIQTPTAYVHYHGNARADVGRHDDRDHRGEWQQQQPQGPVVRDHGDHPAQWQQPQPQPQGPVVRDHGDHPAQWQPQPQPQPQPQQGWQTAQPQPQPQGPVVRDHDDRRDVKEERKDERREMKEERKEDKKDERDRRKDEKEERKEDKKRGR